MACKPKPLTDEHKAILKALEGADEPLATKQISLLIGLDSKVVSSKMKTLKSKGFINSPVRCKYSITDDGKGEL